MPFAVYDYLTDIRNVLVTPQIRSRFLRMQPGQVANLHSHDLGHEVFLVLAGRAVFAIEGEEQELGPGQMCVVLANQPHSVRVTGDEPMTMYLSVTPHVQPTHTGRTPEGERLPHRFMPNSVYDIETDTAIATADLIDHHVAAAQQLAEAARTSATLQRGIAEQLKQALTDGDNATAAEARKAMWEAIHATFQSAYALADVWNELAPRLEC